MSTGIIIILTLKIKKIYVSQKELYFTHRNCPFFRVKTDLFYLQCSTEVFSEKKEELHEL